MRSRIEGRSSIGSEGQEDSKDGTRSSISGSLSRPSIVTTTPMMFSNMSMRRRTSDDSGDNFRGVDYDYEHRRNESFLMSEVLPSRVQRLLERRSSQYSDRSSISAQNAAARPSNNAFSPSRANVSRSPFSQMRNAHLRSPPTRSISDSKTRDVEAIAFDFEKNNNASRRRGAATHTIQEGRAIAITSESSMDKKFEDFVNSEAYKRTEGIVSRKDDRIRDSRDYNDDTYDYAIVVVLGMPQTVKPHGIEKIPEVQSTIKGSADENKSPSNFSKTKAESRHALRKKHQRHRRNLGKRDQTLRGLSQDLKNYLKEFVYRLYAAGLVVKIDRHCVDNKVLIKVAAPLKRLYEEAERMGLKMQLKNGTFLPFEKRLKDDFQGSLNDPNSIFRSTQRQQLIMHILRSQYGEGGVDVFGFGPMIFTMFPLHMYTRTKTLEHFWTHPWADIQQRRRTTDGSYDAVPPEGAWGCLKSLSCVLAHFNTITSLPLDRISAYFGEKVAFYDAWLSFLAQWLCWPMFFGLALYAVQGGKFDIGHPAVPFYCLLLVGWAKLFVQYWRQRSAELAHGWGVLDYEQVSEVERPEFKGEKRINPLTGQEEKYYPAHKRLVAIGTTILLHILITGLCAYMMFLAFSSRDEYLENNDGTRDVSVRSMFTSGVSVELLLVPCVVGIVIPIVDFGYRYIAYALTCWANYQFQSAFNKAQIFKMFSFRFVMSYFYMYYYAFGRSGASQTLLSAQLFMFIVSGIIMRWIFRYITPGFLKFLAGWRLNAGLRCADKDLTECGACWWPCFQFCPSYVENNHHTDGGENGEEAAHAGDEESPAEDRRASSASEGKGEEKEEKGQRCFACRMCCLKCFVKLEAFSRQLKPVDIQEIRELKKGDRGHGASISGRANTVSQAWIEAHLQIYDNFEDYYSMIIMFGYVIFFSASFPLAPLIVFLACLIELRFCAWKMCSFHQRPEALRAGGIGIWQHVLQWMTVIGLLTNVAIIGPTIVSWFPNLEVGQRVFLIFMFEHILLGLYYAAWHLIPERSHALQVKIAREERLSMKGRNPLAKPSHVFAASART